MITTTGTPSRGRIATLESLQEHLQWAIELEHFTIPPYLCALYSLDPVRNADAAEVIALLRARLPRRAEYKANQLLRPEQGPAVEWLLTFLRGRAHVNVIDKTGYVAARVLELFTDEPS